MTTVKNFKNRYHYFAGLFIILVLISFCRNIARGQTELTPWSPALQNGYWPAHWITCPGIPANSYGVFHFRKTFSLTQVPHYFIIHVTADNRYQLFVNGKSIGRGPARGDLYNWNDESYDIATYLSVGNNCIAALVWNMGEYAPVAQISARTGFLLQADDGENYFLDTNPAWKVLHDTAYAPCATSINQELKTYFVTGPGDEVYAKDYPYGWEQTRYDDSAWPQAVDVPAAAVPFGYGSNNIWTLVPSMIPQMEYKVQRLQHIRLRTPVAVSDTFIDGQHPFTIPASQQIKIVLDQSFETVGYPVLKVSGGNGSAIKIIYAESGVDSQGRKGNRNDIAGKVIKGLYDIFHPDGEKNITFSSLWVRTYRYIELDITTLNDPLTIKDFYGVYTGYPFNRLASFTSNDSSLQQIWETGWHTARLCAGENYFDCPYYEQLQYEGDTRIQALISLYNTNDDRLVRKAIHDFYDSRVANGLTQGRFPSNRLQVIPTYSLFWISMLHDYWMLRPDTSFIKKYLSAAIPILDWYERHVDPKYEMLGPMDWWSFVDWVDAFPGGAPDGATNGHSSIITEQFIYTLHQASELFQYFGDHERAEHYSRLADALSNGVYKNCFDLQRMEMANTPDKNTFSQHASIFAVLAEVVPHNAWRKVIEQTLTDTSLSQGTYYFRFYLTRAMVKAGLGDDYYGQLKPWRDMLEIGLTTFSEKPDPTRSDCHAWSASPVYDFLATICGIQPAAPGFRKIAIIPHLGALTHVTGAMPDADGEISVDLKRNGASGVNASIMLPSTTDGYFEWDGKQFHLHGGDQEINLP